MTGVRVAFGRVLERSRRRLMLRAMPSRSYVRAPSLAQLLNPV